MRLFVCPLVVVAAIACAPVEASAQTRTAVDGAIAPRLITQPVSSTSALGIEMVGGTLGSAIGFGSVVLLADRDACGDNLSCTLGNAAAAVLLGTVGAAGGAYLAGRLAGTEPSGVGAIVGAIAGAGAVIGIDHVLSGASTSDTSRYVAFAVAQGLLTALGSRAGALLR